MGLVQTSGKQQTNTGGTSVVFNAPSNFTVGNWVVLTWETNPYKTSITGGGGTTLIEHNVGAPFGSQLLGISSFKVVNSATNDITFTFPSGTTNAVTCSFEEWDNFQTATPVDSVPTEVGGTSITSATLAQANEVVYAVAVPNGVGGSAPTGPAGFAQTWAESSASFPNGAAGYQVVTSTSPVTATFTNVGDVLMATFRSAGAAGNAPKRLMTMGVG